jgi:hypothetical protein
LERRDGPRLSFCGLGRPLVREGWFPSGGVRGGSFGTKGVLDCADPTFEQMPRHWFYSFGTNLSAESFLRSHEVPARPWFCGSTKKLSTDFILLFLPPCGPHLTLLATGSLERNLLVFSTHGGIGNDLSRLFFTCTNTSQVATCTCNT